ncbi:MAG: tetraacyldisaccharide 4'-kinase [Alphaproteobacteria bacterium]|nr:tetraacyldisaccharide 4'-kinase [Alphaproteobacteria bacterium]
MMRLAPPSFWYRAPGSTAPLAEEILILFSKLYTLITRLYQRTRPAPIKLPIPVLCIGNINAGGTGKTPAAVALFSLIKAYGIARRPAFLLRGYGSAATTVIEVQPSLHDVTQVGDEALLLVQYGATFVAADRVKGAKEILLRGHDFIIMDDGFQNTALHKDLQFVVVNGALGFGNGHVLPAGPLREPLTDGFARADGFFLIGTDQRDVRATLPAEKSVWRADIKLASDAKISSGQRYLAFAGLGNPQRFFEFLQQGLKLDLIDKVSFPDHYCFQPHDLEKLAAQARQMNARLVTTEKDAMRLPQSFLEQVTVVPVALTFEEPESLALFIRQRLDA